MPLPHRAAVDAMVDRHFRYEMEDDVDGVLSTLLPDAVHDTVGSPTGPLQGHDAARAFYAQLFSDIQGDSVRTVRRLYGEQFVVDESLWQGHAHGRPFGIAGEGRPLSFRILHIFELDEQAQIRRENVWIDFMAILAQLGALPAARPMC